MGVPGTAKLVYGIDLGHENNLDLSKSIHAKLLMGENGLVCEDWAQIAEGLLYDNGHDRIELIIYGAPHYSPYWILGCRDLSWSTCDFEIDRPKIPALMGQYRQRLESACELLGIPLYTPSLILALELH